MTLLQAVLVAGLGGAGLYVLGKTAVEQRRIHRSGAIEVYEDAPTVAEELVAWTVAMVALGATIQSVPMLLAEASTWR